MLLEHSQSGGATQTRRPKWPTPMVVSLALVALTTLIVWPVQAQLNHQHLIFIYLVPTSLVAIRYGSTPAMAVTLASSIASAYFIYAPRFSFLMTNPLDVLELLLFCLLALLASQVVSGFAKDADIATRRQRRPLRERWPLIAALWNRGRAR